MAGLLHKSRKNKQKKQASQQTPIEYDYSFDDDLESITAQLPGMENDSEGAITASEETASDTPEEALAKFRMAHGYNDAPAEIPQ